MACSVLIPGLLRILGAGAVLGIICWQTRELFFTDFLHWDFFSRFTALAIGGIVVGGIYIAACFLFRVPELESFARRFLAHKK
jgi:peptidoglycan biosynthesis protein MviN/MurJ (putative lipid II flippase)